MMAHHHRRLAEVYYTWGGEENLPCARKYYAAALDMSGGSDVRALYGLALADRRLRRFETKRSKEGSGSGSIDAGGEGVDALGADAAAFLQKLYAAACPELLPVVEKPMALRMPSPWSWRASRSLRSSGRPSVSIEKTGPRRWGDDIAVD